MVCVVAHRVQGAVPWSVVWNRGAAGHLSVLGGIRENAGAHGAVDHHLCDG
jgi:hypothetical protein